MKEKEFYFNARRLMVSENGNIAKIDGAETKRVKIIGALRLR